jgi:hypothetical protein
MINSNKNGNNSRITIRQCNCQALENYYNYIYNNFIKYKNTTVSRPMDPSRSLPVREPLPQLFRYKWHQWMSQSNYNTRSNDIHYNSFKHIIYYTTPHARCNLSYSHSLVIIISIINLVTLRHPKLIYSIQLKPIQPILSHISPPPNPANFNLASPRLPILVGWN